MNLIGRYSWRFNFQTWSSSSFLSKEPVQIPVPVKRFVICRGIISPPPKRKPEDRPFWLLVIANYIHQQVQFVTHDVSCFRISKCASHKLVKKGSYWNGVLPLWTSQQITPNEIYYLSIYEYLSIYGCTALVDLGRFFSFLIFTASRSPWTEDQPVERPLPTHRTTQTQNRCTQASMSRVGFEPTIPMFEGAKTVHALDRAAITIARLKFTLSNNSIIQVLQNSRETANIHLGPSVKSPLKSMQFKHDTYSYKLIGLYKLSTKSVKRLSKYFQSLI
jgi:hypothetical protein